MPENEQLTNNLEKIFNAHELSPFQRKTSNPTFSQYIHTSKYARWEEDQGKRENWKETVTRWADFWYQFLSDKTELTEEEIISTVSDLSQYIYELEAMPSMRTLMTAGKALNRDHVAGYNCAFVAVDDYRVFDETMYILMVGTGVGFSVERQHINKLPTIAEEFYETDTPIKVRDSRIGWASAYRELVSLLYAGKIPKWDTNGIRPKGSRLKTFGGQASGPEPLERLFRFTVNTFKNAAGRKLNSLECHDLMTSVGDCVVSGGVRRSALISLSNLSDDRMRNAKSGQWWESHPNRALANNSAGYNEKPDFEVFFEEMMNLYKSKSGERGIFSHIAAQKKASENGRRDGSLIEGTNPCSEILLRNSQFCNLSEVVVRPDDTIESLKTKVQEAAIIGTFQSLLTDFRYLRKIWRRNTEEERLLGVSLTGVMDHPVLREDSEKSREWLESLRDATIETNAYWADRLGIPRSAAVTCCKPSGTVSAMVDSASGIHPRFSRYYLRTARANKTEPVAQFMIDKGFYYEEDVMKPDTGYVFYFPMKSPDESVCANDVGGVEQLKVWQLYHDHYCEHKPSMTVYYTDDDFFDIASFVWKNFDKISGVSFLPYDDHTYDQAPFIAISEEEYKQWCERVPSDIDWDELSYYESQDNTNGTREYACTADGCSIV